MPSLAQWLKLGTLSGEVAKGLRNRADDPSPVHVGAVSGYMQAAVIRILSLVGLRAYDLENDHGPYLAQFDLP